MKVSENMETKSVATTGMLPIATASEELFGGEAILLVGYDDSKISIVKNSWAEISVISGIFIYFTLIFKITSLIIGF